MSDDLRARALVDQVATIETSEVAPWPRVRFAGAASLLSVVLIALLSDVSLFHPVVLGLYAIAAGTLLTRFLRRRATQRRIDRVFELDDQVNALAGSEDREASVEEG